jgi:polysaccharide export outer membrane protein
MFKNISLLIILVFFAACTGEWSDYPQSQYSETDREQMIESGDTLKVSVFGEPELSGEYSVLNDGTIQIPLIGIIDVEKKSLEQAREVIEESFIKKGYLVNPKITLSIAQSRTVKIMGEIMQTGEYPFTTDMTVLDLVAKAGGFSYRANQNDFDIVRKHPDGFSEKMIPGKLSTRVKPGDIVRVKERFF